MRFLSLSIPLSWIDGVVSFMLLCLCGYVSEQDGVEDQQ